MKTLKQTITEAYKGGKHALGTAPDKNIYNHKATLMQHGFEKVHEHHDFDTGIHEESHYHPVSGQLVHTREFKNPSVASFSYRHHVPASHVNRGVTDIHKLKGPKLNIGHSQEELHKHIKAHR